MSIPNDTPTGWHNALPVSGALRPYDLAVPFRPLVPRVEPLRNLPSAAEVTAAEKKHRESLKGAHVEALTEWQLVRAKAEGSPVAVAVLDMHRPQNDHSRITCGECLTDEWDEAVSTPWPCPTFEMVKELV